MQQMQTDCGQFVFRLGPGTHLTLLQNLQLGIQKSLGWLTCQKQMKVDFLVRIQ